MRDNYAVGSDRILMVASNRISAFDVTTGEPITGKLALFWFDKLTGIVPNHLIGFRNHLVVLMDRRRRT